MNVFLLTVHLALTVVDCEQIESSVETTDVKTQPIGRANLEATFQMPVGGIILQLINKSNL